MTELAEKTDPLIQMLQQRFKLEEFRVGQRDIISTILSGRDVLAVLPTGGGKSLCFQLPALMAGKLVVVISPLIALMKDQVQALQMKGIPAGALYSGQTEDEKREIFRSMQKQGAFVLYLSPERAQKEGFRRWIEKRSVALFAIDEAHCVSQWGHDFREEYSQLRMLKEMRPEIPILALTASATPVVLNDIAQNLSLQNPARMVHGFYRPNLYYQVEICAGEQEKMDLLVQALHRFNDGRAIIYCGTRRSAEEVAGHLRRVFKAVGHYHAGLSTDERNKTQSAYQKGELKILVATNAFGMGIDQPDVRLVAHYQLPANIDSLYQEMGRAGRDGRDSTCLLLYARKDKGLQSFFIESSQAPKAIKSSRWRNLEALVNYAEGSECRHAEILTYYKDAQRIQQCGHCDSCLPQSDRRVVPLDDAPSVIKLRPEPVGRTRSPSRRKSASSSSSAIHLDSAAQVRFEALKQWRKARAQEHDLPAFVIFNDRTLRELAVKVPTDMNDLRSINGIGEHKLEKFGAELLKELASLD